MRLLILLAAILATSSCAFIDQRVTLKYTPTGGGAAPAGVMSRALPTRVEVDVTLARAKGGEYIIGNVKNGWGMTTADTITSNKIDDWIIGALTSELRADGLGVRKVAQLPADAEIAAHLIVRRVWVEHDVGFWTVGALSELRMVADLYVHGELVKKLAIDVKEDTRAFAGMSEQKEKSLEKALRGAMRELAPEMRALRPH